MVHISIKGKRSRFRKSGFRKKAPKKIESFRHKNVLIQLKNIIPHITRRLSVDIPQITRRLSRELFD